MSRVTNSSPRKRYKLDMPRKDSIEEIIRHVPESKYTLKESQSAATLGVTDSLKPKSIKF